MTFRRHSACPQLKTANPVPYNIKFRTNGFDINGRISCVVVDDDDVEEVIMVSVIKGGSNTGLCCGIQAYINKGIVAGGK
jgi:hypothetical protein